MAPLLHRSPSTVPNLNAQNFIGVSCTKAEAYASPASFAAPYSDVWIPEYSSGVGTTAASPYRAEVEAKTRSGILFTDTLSNTLSVPITL